MNSLKGESEKASTYPMLGEICKKGRYLRETGMAGGNRIGLVLGRSVCYPGVYCTKAEDESMDPKPQSSSEVV